MFPVGSSASRIIGRLTNARAMATRCCSPPDSSSGMRSYLPSEPTRSRTWGRPCDDGRCRPITSSANATFWKTLLFGSSRKSWNTQPIAPQVGHLPLVSRRDPRPATWIFPPVGRLLQDQPEEGRLPRPRRADEEDELALVYVEGDIAKGDDPPPCRSS